jgi:phosphoglycolate phosphatase-like HAD superfamily hydrolase
MSDALPIFVFDKDGVIVESEPIKLRLFEELFAADHAEHVPAIRKYNRANIGMARRDKLEYVLGNLIGIREDLEREIDQYLDRSYHFVKAALLKAPPVAGVLPFIRESPHTKYVCSSALHAEVVDQLQALGIQDHFAEVYAFPDKKANVLLALKKLHPGKPIVFWGDTILDYNASQKAQVTFIGVRKPDGNPFLDLGVHTISDFEDSAALHAWITGETSV